MEEDVASCEDVMVDVSDGDCELEVDCVGEVDAEPVWLGVCEGVAAKHQRQG